MRPAGHENVATVLVDPDVLADFELDLMAQDFRVWAVQQVTTFPDAPRLAFQSWLDGDEPVPWPAHAALWDKLSEYTEHVRYNLGLGGVPRLGVPQDPR
jgi:hypothetical protein